MKRILLAITLLFCLSGKAQEPFALDTTVVAGDTVVLFSDKSWEYMRMLHFDGVTNPWINEIVQSDSNYQWVQGWDNHMPYTRDNDLSFMPDTLWICTVDSNHYKFCIPHPGMVTSRFKYRGKRFHYGIDVDLVTGDTLSSAFDGIVRYAEYNDGGFGNLIIIRHFNGLETYYAHLSEMFVTPNQEVKAGDHIGLGGKTGRAYGDHLHFEIRFYGNAIDPEAIIDFENNCLRDENLLIHKGLFDYRAVSTNKKYQNQHPAGSTSPEDVPKVKYHKVKSGDSLYAIALKYKTTVNRLCQLNNIKSSKILHIGDVIQVRE